jgi:hypothetical protein
MFWLPDASIRRYRARLARRIAWGALGIFVAGVGVAFASGALGGILISLAFVAGIGSAFAKSPVTLHSGPLRADASGLWSSDGRSLVDRDAVREGVVTSSGMGARAELTTHDGNELHVGANTWVEAESVLTELGLDVANRRASIDLSSDIRVAVGLILAYFGVFFLGALPFILFVAGAALAAVIVAALLPLAALTAGLLSKPPVVEVGGDAVVLQWRHKRVVVPLREVAAVVWTPTSLGLQKHDGHKVAASGAGMSSQAIRAAAMRIQQALHAYRSSSTPQVALDALSRRGRDLATWKRDLGSIVGHSAGYRSTAIDAEAVAQALESKDADPAQRAGAAMLLATHPDPEMRARVRIAVERTASPKLRVALGQVLLNAPDAALDQALAEAEAEHTKEKPAFAAVSRPPH